MFCFLHTNCIYLYTSAVHLYIYEDIWYVSIPYPCKAHRIQTVERQNTVHHWNGILFASYHIANRMEANILTILLCYILRSSLFILLDMLYRLVYSVAWCSIQILVRFNFIASKRSHFKLLNLIAQIIINFLLLLKIKTGRILE